MLNKTVHLFFGAKIDKNGILTKIYILKYLDHLLVTKAIVSDYH